MIINWTNVEDQHPVPRKLLLFAYKVGPKPNPPCVFDGVWDEQERWAKDRYGEVYSSLPNRGCHLWWAEMIDLPETPK